MLVVCTCRSLSLPLIDHGDIGEVLRFDNLWVMYGKPHHWGVYWTFEGEDRPGAADASDAATRRVDILAGYKAGNTKTAFPAAAASPDRDWHVLDRPPSERWPTWHWEKFFFQVSGFATPQQLDARHATFGEFLCWLWQRGDPQSVDRTRSVQMASYRFNIAGPGETAPDSGTWHSKL